jgi:hypothetical protein
MWTTVLVLSSLLWQAPRLTCPESETKSIKVDGILNEWSALTTMTLTKSDIVSGADRRNNDKDLSVELRSTYIAGEGVYFLIEVTDRRIIVGNRNSSDNDRVVLSIGDPKKKITFTPPDDTRKAVIDGLPKNAMGRVVRQELGYAIEFGIPWGTWDVQPDLIELPLSITVYDSDSAAAPKTETVMALDAADFPKATKIEFAAIANLQQEVFDKLGVSEGDVKYRHIGNYAAGKKLERALWVGRYIVLLGGDIGISFFYIQLSDDADNILKCQALDVDGDGVMDWFTELKIPDGANEWKLVAVWAHQPRGIARIFGHMLEFSAKEHFVVNAYKLTEKSKKYTIEFSFVKASPSITQKNWKGNPPDPDINPFILPWDKPAKRSFSFAFGKYTRNK